MQVTENKKATSHPNHLTPKENVLAEELQSPGLLLASGVDKNLKCMM